MKVLYLGKSFVARRVKLLIAFVIVVLIIFYYLMSQYMWKTEEAASAASPVVHQKLVPAAKDASWDWLDNDKNKEAEDELLHSVPVHLIRQHKCPACFGDEICDDIHNGDLQIEISKEPGSLADRGVYFGRWQGKAIVVKTLDNLSFHNFEKFDQFICRNQSLPENCDVSSAIQNPRCIAVQESSFMPESLQQAWKIAHSGPAGLAFAVCATSELIQELSWGFDTDHDGQMNEAQVAMLYTSMVINPEAMLLRFFSGLKLDLPVPEFLGACGRLVVASHGGAPLSHFLTSPFLQRAELALQALEMIHLFIYGDPTWFIFFGDYKAENFAVNSDGQLVVVDLEDIAIIDKRRSRNYQFGQVEYSQPCNHECFGHFAAGLWDTASPHHARFCEQSPHVTGMAMYALLCSNLLADTHTRRRMDVEGGDAAHTLRHEGLLANPPAAHKEYLEEMLEECIVESAPEGRIQAVKELKEWLEDIVHEQS